MKAILPFFARVTVEDNFVIVVLAILCLAASIGIGAYIIWYTVRWSSAKKWICVDGHITEFQEEENKYGSGPPKIRIRYEYSVNQIRQEGCKYQLGLHRDRPVSIDITQSLRHAYASSGVIKVFADPLQPKKSVLNIDFDRQGIGILIGVGLIALLPLILF